jgi:hypothetical protein
MGRPFGRANANGGKKKPALIGGASFSQTAKPDWLPTISKQPIN